MSDRRCFPIAVAEARAESGWTRLDAYGTVSEHQPSGQESAHAEPESLEQAWSRGFADGEAAAAKAHAEETSQLRALLAAANALQPEPSAELAVVIARAVIGLTRAAVGEAPVDSDWLRARAEEAAAIVSQCDGAQTVWMHPDDVALLDGETLALPVYADPAAARGSVRIACSSGWIDHGRPLYLEQLDAMLAADGVRL